MKPTLFGPAADDFVWATGIEDTFIPQAGRADERPLDEYELTGHYAKWREDVDLAIDLGVDAMRLGVPWYRIEESPGRFEWDWMDRVLAHAADNGIAVIVDLIHFGTPLWLDDQFADPSYPQRVAEYANEFARRYKDLVSHYTPQDPPSVTASVCGDLGMWPPYLEGEDGAVQLIRSMARGLALTVEAIREADPEATIVSVDGALGFLPAPLDTAADLGHLSPGAAVREATILSLRTFMGTDLVTGRVGASHPLTDWLIEHGMTEADLNWHQAQAVDIDVIGLDYYPQFTVMSLHEIVAG